MNEIDSPYSAPICAPETGGGTRLAINPSTAKGPEPSTTRAARQARYKRSVSLPGGPNRGPAAVTATYGRCGRQHRGSVLWRWCWHQRNTLNCSRARARMAVQIEQTGGPPCRRLKKENKKKETEGGQEPALDPCVGFQGGTRRG